MIIKQLVFDRVRNEYVGEHLVESPPSVEFDSVQSWLARRFGPVLDLAYTDDERGERIAVGWTFDLPDGIPVDGTRSAFEIVMIPMLTDPGTGTLVSAFDWQAKEKRRFEKMAADGLVDKLTIDRVPQQPWSPPKDR